MSVSDDEAITYETMRLSWNAAQRVATMTFATGTHLTGKHGAVIAETLSGWVGASSAPFAFLADAKHVTGTDADYRSATGAFFKQHRRDAFIALLNLNPVIAIVAEMFRIGVGLNLKSFPSEEKARAWLRENGVPA